MYIFLFFIYIYIYTSVSMYQSKQLRPLQMPLTMVSTTRSIESRVASG